MGIVVGGAEKAGLGRAGSVAVGIIVGGSSKEAGGTGAHLVPLGIIVGDGAEKPGAAFADLVATAVIVCCGAEQTGAAGDFLLRHKKFLLQVIFSNSARTATGNSSNKRIHIKLPSCFCVVTILYRIKGEINRTVSAN